MQSPYDRLPAAAEGVVRDTVWTLSRDSAGLYIAFGSAVAHRSGVELG